MVLVSCLNSKWFLRYSSFCSFRSTFWNPYVKTRHLGGSGFFCLVGIGVVDKVLGWFPLGFVKDKLLELSRRSIYVCSIARAVYSITW